MATPAQIRAAVDTKLAALWSAIQTQEIGFLSNNQRYWQGKMTHSVIPADGVETLPDVGTAAPSYQGNPWPVAIRNTALPMALEITQYDGPSGLGFVATVSVVIAGNLWQRAQDSGAEPYRQYNWTNMGPPS